MKHLPTLVSIPLVIVPLLLLLPGCGGGSGSGGPNPTVTPTTATPTPTTTTTPTTTPTATATPTVTPTFRPVREFYVDIQQYTSVVEGDSGQKVAKVTVIGYDTYGEHYPLNFSYETRDGSALAVQDYITTRGKSQVVTGESTIISVPILGDTKVEEDETFTFHIFNAQGRYSSTDHPITIKNDD